MISRIYSQNMHKHKAWTSHLLKTDTDIIMIQEPPRYHVKCIPSGTDPLGTAEHGMVHHPNWSKIYFHTKMAVYINLNILKTHNLFLFPCFDNNVMAFTLQLTLTEEPHHFINMYNNKNQPTLGNLLAFLEQEDLTNLYLLGDFNLHSPEWDLECDKVDAKATALANGAAKAGLILLNDNDKPTWIQPGKTPSGITLPLYTWTSYLNMLPLFLWI
jgi:hypothetical protein